MKKLLLALFAVAGITSAHAQLSANLTATSDYRFRGISQTQNGAAVQGGVDYAHESGFYIGNWNSTVSPIDIKIQNAVLDAKANGTFQEWDDSKGSLFDQMFGEFYAD